MIADPLPLMVRYLDGNTTRMLTHDEVEVLLFALYLESLKTNPRDGLAAKGTMVLAAQGAYGKRGLMVFVFGSNEQGIHGAGAAKVTAMKHGAKRGKGEGHVGNSYALPTRKVTYQRAGGEFTTLTMPEVQAHVDTFIKYATEHPELLFQVTAIGTGHAGLEHEDMAPLFAAAPDNCQFDTVWEEWLPNKKFWGTY